MHLTMFCLRKDNSSISSTVMSCGAAATIFEKENLEGSRDHPIGGGMLGNYQQNSNIVLLCIYSLSNIYIYI